MGTQLVGCEARRAFRASLNGYRSVLLSLARGRYRTDVMEEDLVQETLRCALEHEEKLIQLDERQVGAWLATTMHRRFIDHCRRRKTEEHAQRGLEYLLEKMVALHGAKMEAWRRVTQEQYARALQGLPENARTAFELKALGLRNKDIAAKLNIPYNTVGTLLFRARRYLKQQLVDAIPPSDDYDEDL